MIQKITPFQYAVLLYGLTSDGKEVAKKLESFFGLLAKNNDLGKIKQIIREFEIYEKKQKGIREVGIVSARPLAKEAKKLLMETIGDGKVEVTERIDENLLGGMTLTMGDMLIDGSFRKKLKELQRALA